MHKHTTLTLSLASLIMALAIMNGAFAAHALKAKLDAYELSVFETAVKYQAYHALGLFMLALAQQVFTLRWFKLIRNMMLSGLFIFCITLYLLSTASLWTSASVKWLGAITPIGGLLLICSWLLAAYSFYNTYCNTQK